jgi:serine-type D-Ala-D-Ala carboxypeptidase/endopeptidase (penicillin-binding protein 4)
MTCFAETPLRRMVAVALLLMAVSAVAVADGARLDAPVSNRMTARLTEAEGRRGKAACVVLDLDSGQRLFSRRADEALIPASNMKLVTSIAALHMLGSDFEFVTRLLARGRLDGGVLQGDLVFVGGGDPNLSGRFHEGDPLALYRAWARALKTHGLNLVEGDLVFDSHLFHGPAFHEGWPGDDQYVRWYCAEVSALAFNDNCVQVRVFPRRAGQAARAELNPTTAFAQLVNEARTAAGRSGAEIGVLRPRDGNVIAVRGRVFEQASWGYATDVTVTDGAAYAATVLRETLEAEGIAVTGRVLAAETAVDTSELLPLVVHRSKLSDALPAINRNSQNLHAEMLFRMLGVKHAGNGSFGGGQAAVNAWLREQGLWSDALFVSDGSGLARDNRVTAGLLAELLLRAGARDDFEVFRDSLAVGGESGTLERRLNSRNLRGRVFAKTGYIRGVRALSGYLLLDQRRVAFAMLMNQCVNERQAQDDLLEILATALR